MAKMCVCTRFDNFIGYINNSTSSLFLFRGQPNWKTCFTQTNWSSWWKLTVDCQQKL